MIRSVWRALSLIGALSALVGAGCAEGPRSNTADACDPFAPDCAPQEVCAITDQGPRCRPRTTAPTGRNCSAASCPAGQACATVEGVLRCRPLCSVGAPDDHPCPEGPICRYRLADSDLGVCAARCQIGDGCPAGAGCGISTALPYPICVALGSATEGEACSDMRCAEGLACLEVVDPDMPDAFVERCTRLCDPATVRGGICRSGTCAGRILGVEGAGYCTDDS